MSSVVVIGGGYGGIAVARELDPYVSVTLLEPKDRFVHNVAALRGLVDPHWAEAMFLPYDKLLVHGDVRHDRGTRVDVDADGATVELRSGGRLRGDYAVLATGSSYPFPAKLEWDERATGLSHLATARGALAASSSVLLVGAGPTGLELAGEIRDTWPDTAVTVLDRSPTILPGPLPDELRQEICRQLDAMEVRLVLDAVLEDPPPLEPGQHGAFVARTTDGRRIDADIWFRCYGVSPVTADLGGDLAGARRPDGFLEVTEHLRLRGQQRVFAVGDVTAVPETKTAKAAEQHAEVVAANIRALLDGATDLRPYQPGPPGIALPLGQRGGASYSAATGLLDAARTAELKGTALNLDRYRDKLRTG